jgi:hypothetical protein
MMSDMISLVGLDKAAVFAALYNGARAQGLGFLHYDPTSMTAETARQRFGSAFGYFDYVDGRVMKVNLEGDELNPWLYDRDNGAGAAETIINALRDTQDTNPEEAELIHKEGTRNAAILMNEHLYDDTEMDMTGDVANIRLGLSNVADVLKPRLDDVLNENDDTN